MSTSIKKRNWAFVVYPESLPGEWLDILTETGLPIAISPLHDQDINESTGEHKKPHYHVICCYSGPTSFNVVKKITDKLNAPIPISIESVKGAYRYLTHRDNPEKFQYDPKDIKTLNGFNILDYSDLTKGEVLALKKQALEIIRQQDLIEYVDLIDYCWNNDLSDLLDVTSSNTIFFNHYLSSKRNKGKDRFAEQKKFIKEALIELSHDYKTNNTEKKLLEMFGEYDIETE